MLAIISVAFVLFESFTSTYETFLVPCGLMFHWVGLEVLLKVMRLPAEPVRVSVPAMV